MTQFDPSPAAARAPGGTAPLPGVRKSRTAVLAGRRILVTRPAEQAGLLASAIEAAGGTAWRLPTLRIEPLSDGQALDQALRSIAGYDLVVFVSANAVEQSHARCLALGLRGLAEVACGAAPGPATAAALAAHGARRVVVPDARFDSEGLIAALVAAGVAPKKSLILRGADAGAGGVQGSGRERLAEWLRGRGGAVDSLACYRRARAAVDASSIQSLIAGPSPDAVLVTSSEGGEALVALLGAAGNAWLLPVPMFVPHPRIATRMRALGLRDVHVTAGGDHGLLEGLAAHFSGTRE